MSDEGITSCGPARIAADLAAGRYSSLEATAAFIDRIERCDRDINAVVVRRFEQALAEARAADAARAAGLFAGPLHGIPITIKESFDFTGLPSTYGHPERTAHRATTDAASVARLKAAGAIVLGKTNVPKDLADWQTFNAVYGETRNPWDLTRSPGGSSGGAAAALSANMTSLELASDIGGSIRTPASFCGVYGHKPTFGIVPIHGANAADETLAPRDILVAGPMGKTGEDLELAFDVLTGSDIENAVGFHAVMAPEARTSLDGWSVALVTDDSNYQVDQPVRAHLAELADRLEREGCRVDRSPVLPLPSEDHYDLYLTLLRSVTSSRYSLEQIEALRPRANEYSPSDRSYDAIMHRGLTLSHAAWIQADDRRLALRRQWGAFFSRYDVLLCPATTTTAFLRDAGILRKDHYLPVNGTMRPAADNYYWIGLASLSYLPATVIPIGLDRGLPLGAQIVGPEFGDKRCLRFALLLDAVLDPLPHARCCT